MARIFISHSSSDPVPTRRIKAWLEDKGFENPFVDVDMAPGADWERELYRQLEQSLAVILMVTPGWLASKWCFAEFTQARALGKPIFPVLETAIEGAVVAPEIQHLDLIRDREGGLERLLGELERIQLETQGGFPFPPERSPYPGLRPFDEQDAAIYFGRDDEIRRLRELLRARRSQGGSRLVVVLGASGSGKSSLMRAGVLPRIKREGDRWIVVGPFRPLERPVEQLAMSLTVALQRTGSFELIQSMLETDAARGIEGLVRDLRLHAGQPDAFVLFAIDQGEELFSMASAEQRGRFLEILSTVAAGNQPAAAVMTFRSDFLGLLQSDPALASEFHDYKVNPLPSSRIPEVIRGPARVVGLSVDDRMVLKASQDASRGAALPLLAFALRELYERHGSSGRLSVDQYDSLGDAVRGLNPLENVVRETADRIVNREALSQGDLNALRDAFIPALVRVSTDGEYVRRSARWRDLPATSKPLLERLLTARLLTASGREGEGLIEVSHEALLRDWPLLRGWLDEEREFLLGKEQLQRDLADWQDASPERRTQALLTGLKLSRARAWLAERPYKLEDEERLFIRDSIESADRAARQRAVMRRALVWGSLGASALLAIAAGFSALQWKVAQAERDQARAALLAVESQVALEARRIYDAVERARQAMATRSMPATRTAMLQSLLNLPPQLQAQRSSGDDVPMHVASPALPERLLVATNKGRVISIDRDTLELSAGTAFAGEDSSRILALSEAARGNIIVVRESGVAESVSASGAEGGETKKIRLGARIVAADVLADQGLLAFLTQGEPRARIARCDFAAGVEDLESCERQEGPVGRVSAVRIDPAGGTVAFGTEDGKVFLYEVGTQTQPVVMEVGSRVLSLAWDLTGTWLAVGTIAGSDAGAVVVIDATAATVVGTEATRVGVRALAWNADATAVAGTCGRRGVGVCVWSRIATGLTLSAELFGHRELVQSIAWGDGRLTSLGLDNSVLGWVPARRSAVFRILALPGLETELTDVDAAVNAPRLAIGTADGAVLVFDLETGKLEISLQAGSPESIASVSWDPGAKHVAASDHSGRVLVWDSGRPQPLRTFKIDNQRIDTVMWDPRGGRVFAALRNGRLASMDVDAGVPSLSSAGHEKGALGLAVASDASFVVTSDTFGTLIRWSADTLEVIDSLPSSMQLLKQAVSRDGLSLTRNNERLAVVGNDGKVLIYDVTTRALDSTLETEAIQLQDVAYSADDHLLAALTNEDVIHVWSVATGELHASVNLKAMQTQRVGSWPVVEGHWRAGKMSWLNDTRTLAISTSAGRIVLINFDEAVWSAESGVVMKDATMPGSARRTTAKR